MSKLSQFNLEARLIRHRIKSIDNGKLKIDNGGKREQPDNYPLSIINCPLKEQLRLLRLRIEGLSVAGIKAELQQELMKVCEGHGHDWSQQYDFKVCGTCRKIEITK